MRLPNFQGLKAQMSTPEMLRRLEGNVAAYAQALTGEKGVLRALLEVSGAGRTYILKDILVPDDWTNVTFTPGSGFANVGGLNQVLQVRKTLDGTVKARGVFGRGAGVPPAGSPISSLSTELLSPSRELLVSYNEVPAGSGSISISPNGLKYENGAVAAISLSGLEWTAADRTPLDWPTASQVRVYLGPDFPGEPQAVVVRDAVTATGVHLGPCSAVWSATREDGQWVVTLRRVNGVAPLVTYTLSLAVSA